MRVSWLCRVMCGRRRQTVVSVTGGLVCFTCILYFLSWSSHTKLLTDNYADDSGNFDKYPKCHEKTQFVYIKMIKCASTTLAQVFRRFGILRNLLFVLPPKDHIYIGWPYPIDETFYRPIKYSSGSDILCDHAVYDAEQLHKIMAPGTVYITSIREPFAQFKSMINYYNVLNISSVPWNVSDRFIEYLDNFEHYEATYKSHAASTFRYCIPDGFSMTRNLMSYNLGFPTGGFLNLSDDRANNKALVYRWLSELDEQLYFVIIVEYFHESVVLLRRLMCWKLQDVLFRTSNSLTYGFKSHSDSRLVEKYRNWSRVDFALYDHFNQTLWKRIREQDVNYWVEVEYFRRVNIDVNNFCSHHKRTSQPYEIFHVEASDWSEAFDVTTEFCHLLSQDLLHRLQQNYDEQFPLEFSIKQPSKKTC